MTRITLLLTLLLGAVFAAQAQSAGSGAPSPSPEALAMEQAHAAAGQAYSRRLAGALAADGGARELAFAAILRRIAAADAVAAAPPPGDAPSARVPPDPAVERWLDAAATRAGADVLANQLLIAAGDASAQTLRAQAAQRWQAAEPGNLAPLLWQSIPADALLADARRASHADTRMYEGIRWIAAAYRRHPPDAAERAALAGDGDFDEAEFAAMSAMALWTAIAMPALRPLMEACRGDALQATATRRADCRNVALLLAERSDALVLRHAGLGLLQATAIDSHSRAEAEARQRRMDWQMLQWGEVARRQERDGAAQFVRLLADPAIDTEQQLVERVLAEAGVPLDPPPGWVSPWRRR